MPLAAIKITPGHAVRLVLEGAAAVAAWLGGFELLRYLFSSHSAPIAEYYGLLSILLFTGFAGLRLYQTMRKERYANVAPELHNIQHSIRDIYSFILFNRPAPTSTEVEVERFCENIKDKLEGVLSELQLLFTSITATHCRTSLKAVYRLDEEYYYYTVARDRGTGQQLRRMDNKRVETNHDPLSKNKQFSRLFDDDNEIWHYISDDLTCDSEFTSTSFTAYDHEWAERSGSSLARSMPWKKTRQRWPLPYRSTIACIIRQAPANGIPETKTVALGFLTVDSESRGVFEERWDVQIMFSVADALYHLLREYLEIQNQARTPPALPKPP
jgi:hypothetical protein